MSFQYTSTTEDNFIILQLTGQMLDREQPKEMRAEIEDAIVNGKGKIYIIFDLAELNYINSSGLSVLVTIFRQARKAGGRTALYHVNRKNKDLFHITKLDEIFSICDNKTDAMELLRKHNL